MSYTRIKICGITRPEDGLLAASYGVDAIGLVFYARSPRAVDIAAAREIVAALPPLVSVVALFVDEQREQITRILEQVPIDVLQFHGDESEPFCKQFRRPYLKALRVKPDSDVETHMVAYPGARAVLLDTWAQGKPGGTGQVFDWEQAKGRFSRPLVLAGGLHAGNVGEAIAQVRPAAVDVSGGVERSPGIKDEARIATFIAAVRTADQLSDG